MNKTDSVVLNGRALCKGTATGEVLICLNSIQGWAGVDDQTGVIVEKDHEHKGISIKDKILIVPGSRGSNGWSCHFHGTKISGSAPAGWIVTGLDSRIGVTLAVMDAPSVFCDAAEVYGNLNNGDVVTVDGGSGVISIIKRRGEK